MTTDPVTFYEEIGGFETFRTIVAPLSLPVLASLAIMQFLWSWNDLLYALTLVFVGFSVVTMLTTANGYVQTTTGVTF